MRVVRTQDVLPTGIKCNGPMRLLTDCPFVVGRPPQARQGTCQVSTREKWACFHAVTSAVWVVGCPASDVWRATSVVLRGAPPKGASCAVLCPQNSTPCRRANGHSGPQRSLAGCRWGFRARKATPAAPWISASLRQKAGCHTVGVSWSGAAGR